MEGWEHKPLCEICGFQRGLTYAKSDEVDAPGHTVLRANNIDLTSHELGFKELKFISDSVAVPASKLVRPGSLLVCTASGSKAHLGKVAYIDSDYGYAFGGFMGQLTPSKGVDGRYLFYALISPGYKSFIEALSDGVNINNLKFDDLGRFSVPLPPLPEQRRIVAILDQAFEAIATAKANSEKNLQNARETFDSHLATVVLGLGGSPRVAIGEVGTVFDGPHATPKTVDDGPVFLGISALRDGEVDLSETRHVTPEDFRTWTRRVKPTAGDFVFSYETRLGQAAVVPNGLECCLGRRMGLVRVDQSRLLPHFFAYQYISAPFRAFLMSRTIRGATVDRISIKEFPSFEIALPSLPEQEQLVAKLNSLREGTRLLGARQESKLTALDELKKSLLNQAFSGALTAKTSDKQIAEVA